MVLRLRAYTEPQRDQQTLSMVTDTRHCLQSGFVGEQKTLSMVTDSRNCTQSGFVGEQGTLYMATDTKYCTLSDFCWGAADTFHGDGY